MEWLTVGRPGQTGFKKHELHKAWDEMYGKSNWRVVHTFGERVILKPEVFLICEEAYYQHSLRNPGLWQKLLAAAKDIYDMKIEEVESGTDYSKQHEYTRFHDICIRRVALRRSWKFEGSEIIQIRCEASNPNMFSKIFDPGRIPFHLPEMIKKPHLAGWWDEDSVEDFYQSNKVLQVKQ